jgi:mRNA interferase MazF
MQRGEVWWVDFPKPEGSEPGYPRPAVIVSSDQFNVTAIRTVIVVVVTTNLKLAGAPGNVELPARVAGLGERSVANVSQIATVNKTRLRRRMGALPGPLLSQVEDGVRHSLGLA